MDMHIGLDSGAASFIIPIRSLGPAHCGRITAHLLALDQADRYLRFGQYVSDERIRQYVAELDFDRDEIYGIYNRRLELLAVAHLAIGADLKSGDMAEFGVSVWAPARGRGYGTHLFDRAVMHARNAGIERLYIHALSENAAMLQIAKKAGATLERHGSETDAYLRLPPATTASHLGEMLGEQVALVDYRLKRRAYQWHQLVDGVQEVREGMRDGRHSSGS